MSSKRARTDKSTATAADWKAAAEAEYRMRWRTEDQVAAAVRRMDAGDLDGGRADLREIVAYLLEQRAKERQAKLPFAPETGGAT